MDCHAPFVIFQLVDTDDNTCNCEVHCAARLEIARHIDLHAGGLMICQSGKIQPVLRNIKRRAGIWRQSRIEGMNENDL